MAGRTGAGAQVLVVEDDRAVRAVVTRALEERGFGVLQAEDLAGARAALGGTRVDLVVLDVELGHESGLELLRELSASSPVPVMLLTGRAAEADRLVGFELGAIDYVVKPFLARELAARVNAHLRRRSPAESRTDAGRLTVDHLSREVTVDAERLDLTAREFDLLALLVAGGRRVQSRDQLLQEGWGSSSAWQTPATVTEHVRRVRVKLAAAGLDPDAIETVRGIGYRLDPERWA